MTNKLALDALITALACLSPELNSDHKIQLNTHRAFYVDNPNLFCDARNHLNEKLKLFERQKEENQLHLLKLNLKILQMEDEVSEKRTETASQISNCIGLKNGVHRFKPSFDSKPFYTICDDQKMLILQNFAKNKPKSITNEQAKKGFGVLYDNFFLGLENLSALTKQGCYEAQVTIKNVDYETIYASYTRFKVALNKSLQYAMEVFGCRGDACDVLGKPNKRPNTKENCKEVANTRHWWDFSCDGNVSVKVYLKSSESENCNKNKTN